MRQEIEVKARVNDLKKVEEKLLALGCVMSEPLKQNDITFYIKTDTPYDQLVHGQNILRIREQNGKSIFTIKQTGINDLDSFERETEISDSEEMRHAILLLGYSEAVRINKVRRKTMCQGYEICLDQVEDLGNFVEVEKITENEDPEKVQTELFEFLKQFGVTEADRVVNGYDTLIYRLQNNI